MNIRSTTHHVICLTMLSVNALSGQPAAARDWQERLLFEPSKAQQQQERRGRVYIFDGVHETAVDRALDEQYGRIQSMMFVGVRHTAEDGEEYADSDCD